MDGLIIQNIYPEIPPRVEYSISDKGLTLKPLLLLMCEWGYENFDEDKYELLNPQCHE